MEFYQSITGGYLGWSAQEKEGGQSDTSSHHCPQPYAQWNISILQALWNWAKSHRTRVSLDRKFYKLRTNLQPELKRPHSWSKTAGPLWGQGLLISYCYTNIMLSEGYIGRGSPLDNNGPKPLRSLKESTKTLNLIRYSNWSQCSWQNTGCTCALRGVPVRTSATTFWTAWIKNKRKHCHG